MNSRPPSQRRRSTTSRCRIAIWPAGPPKEMKPSLAPEARGFGERGRVRGGQAAWHAGEYPAVVRRGQASVGTPRTSPTRPASFERWRAARGDVVAGDHLVVRLARTHHRVHAGLGVDDHLEERRALELDELLHHARHVLLAVEAHREAEAVGLRGLDEVLLVQRLVARGQAALEEELLPLPDHAVAEVVQHHHLHGQVVGGDGLELAQVHADAGVAVDVDHEPVAVGELRADRRRQAEAHGAHAARGEPQPRLAEVEVLRGPHLVLADAGGDDGLALRVAVDLLDHVVRLDQLRCRGRSSSRAVP